MRALATATVLVLLLAALATLAAPATPAAAQPAPYGTNDYGGFRDVLPPGTNGLDNAAQLAAFEATGARPPHNDDQRDMYSNLMWASPTLHQADISRFYKDATFGVRPQDVASSESPAPGATILRDRQFGVPHIYGDTRPALMYAIGYATAEDRLFFIDILRHLGRAELTSFAGGAPGNRAFDAMQWSVAPYTDQDLANQIPEGIALADGPLGQRTSAGPNAPALARTIYQDSLSFVAGINAYIAAAKLNPQLMPAEYAAINQAQGPDPFQLSDLVAIGSLVGGIFGKGGGDQLPWTQLLQAFEQRFGADAGYRDWLDLHSLDDPEAPTTVQGVRFPYLNLPQHVAPGSEAIPDPGSVTYPPNDAVSGGGSSGGTADRGILGGLTTAGGGRVAFPRDASNALVVSAAKSASGHPLAVFGPQVAYFAPEILMEQDIHGPGIDAAGAAFPGVNLYVQLGHGRDYAWSATSAGQSIIDTFAVRLCNPSGGPVSISSNYYSITGHCIPMQVLQRVNHFSPNVADSTPAGTETLTAYRTELGLVEARATIHGQPVAYVLDRSTYGHELDSAFGFAELNDPGFVQDARSFQRAVYDIAFTFNWFYVDSQHIAYLNSGENPIRSPGVNPLVPTWGSFPWQGFDPAHNTADYTPFDEHPQAIDQPFFTSWNNKQARAYGTVDWSPVYRSQLLSDRLARDTAGNATMTLSQVIDDMESAGTVDLRAYRVLPYVLQVIGEPSDPTLHGVVAELNAWVADGAHRKAPAPGQPYAHSDAIRILDAWWPLLVQAVYEPTMGKTLFDQLEGVNQSTSAPGVSTIDNVPNNGGSHLGSAWDTTFYGHVQKDLRQLLGLPVAQPAHQVYCGGGNLAACRAQLEQSLAQAAAESPAQVYPADGLCAAGDQSCFDAISFRPLGAITQPLIPWVNRPTFQQADEIQGHRPFPPEPACIYDNLPRLSIATARATASGRSRRGGRGRRSRGARAALTVTGTATPRDCGVPPARLGNVQLTVSRTTAGGCQFVNPRGRLTRARSCQLPVSLTARGGSPFELALALRRLPRGSYRVSATVADVSGNVASAGPVALAVGRGVGQGQGG